jgi:hypothetical protein
VKSTPSRGVKQTLKPDAYRQSEPESVLGQAAGELVFVASLSRKVKAQRKRV